MTGVEAVIKQEQAQEQAQKQEAATELSGHGLLQMFEYKCLVKPAPVQEKTEGGLFLPETAKTKKHWETVECTFIISGGLAFTDPRWPERPQPGDIIYIAKFCDKFRHQGVDGQEYWVINDKDVLALIARGGASAGE